MKRAIMALPLAALVLQPMQTYAGSLSNAERRDRIIHGSMDPESSYQTAMKAVKEFRYDDAKESLLRVIEVGPARNPRYMDAGKWVTKKLWEHMIGNYPMLIASERAAAEIVIDDASRLEGEGRNKELLRAKKLLDEVKSKERKLEDALERLGRR